MAQCQSPEELMKLISRIVDAMVNQYLLCGTLQGGLVACDENAYLPKDTEVVLCRQLYELVQKGIDTGEIVAPTVVEVRYEGSTLILHLANGENLTLDLKPLVDGVIDKAFIDCDGVAIHVGTALATCANLEAVKLALETKLAELDQKVDHNKELTDQEIANTKALLEEQIAAVSDLLAEQITATKEASDAADVALNKRIDDWITDITERMTLLDESITNKIDAATAEWANTVLQQLIEQFLETRQVYHDDSLDGDGHEAAPLKINVEWLRQQIAAYLPEVVTFKDCCGGDISIGDVLVTCECLDTQLAALADELKAYAEQQAAEALTDAKAYADAGDAATLNAANNYTDEKAADTLQQANNYTDEKAADTLQQANNYTDEQISSINVDIPYLRNALTIGHVPIVSNNGLALGYDTKASAVGAIAVGNSTTASAASTTAVGTSATASYLAATALGYSAAASAAGGTSLGHSAAASAEGATAVGNTAKASGITSTALGATAQALQFGTTALGAAAQASQSNATALGYMASATAQTSIALGATAGASDTGATALGYSAKASGGYTTALGYDTKATYASATAIGHSAEASGMYTTALGYGAKASVTRTIAIGRGAEASGASATALGYQAEANYERTTALGVGAAVTGANQVQLGDSVTTTYAYGAVQDRSDKRDKTDVHNSDLGLEFIQKLRPVKFRWDYRDDYINELFPKPKREDFIDASVVNEAEYLVEITDVVREPDEPSLSEADFESTESYELAQQAVHTRNLERQAKYEAALQERREEQLANLAQAKLLKQEQQEAAYAQALEAHKAECSAFMQNPDERKDGSKVRQRYHYGLIADELKDTLDGLGVDFGGYQDHSIHGGMCVKSVGYAELISPLIKAVQELAEQVATLKQQIEGK